ncbi:hypothetical protein JI739_16330 [Ramlibacter sp. AW1]|uniref:LysR substrate-binding domain-containing protein n=1 Tax=Ramlibacter aurantiacus TaxID=2801330 RepID=A0A936ZKK7_9BURK|nr:LysR substrate-binding domain-containing protein [Ramlibacter aurantiacus]MBL0421918.1 hypothetical protein [Ramlibacter aurantiacus]
MPRSSRWRRSAWSPAANAHLLAGLRQEQVDFVIGRLVDPSGMQGLSFEPLYSECLIFVVRDGHPLARQGRVSPASLDQWRLVLPDAGTRIRESADRFFLGSGIGLPERVVETIDASFGRSYVRQTDAVWFVPEGAVEADLREGRLLRLPVDTRSTEGAVGLTVRAGYLPSAAVQRLLEDIRRCVPAARA